MTLSRLKINPVYLTQPLFNSCFYGLKSIFVLYIIDHLSLSNGEAISIYSTFMALCYATTLLGGYIADHGLGVKNAVLVGGALTVSGLFCILLPSVDLCLLGMALVSMGSGFFKPNLLAAVGLTFENLKDPEKDRTYSVNYITGNAGIFSLIFLCGFVGKWFGWRYGILLVASIFMGATWLAYKAIRIHPAHQNKKPISTVFQSKPKLWTAITFITGFLYLLMKYPWPFHGMMAVIISGSALYFIVILFQSIPQERKDLLMVAGYIILFALFVTLFEQSGSSMTLFLEHAVDREVMGVVFPSATILSLGAFFVFTCGPILIYLTSKYMKKTQSPKNQVSDFTKGGWGFVLASLSFLLLAGGAGEESGALVPIAWIVGAIFMQTMGELLIAPISLSKVSQHSPTQVQSTMMSFWTMVIAYGHYFAGLIAQFSIAAKPEDSLGQYQIFFLYLGLAAFGVGISVFLCQAIISRFLRAPGR